MDTDTVPGREVRMHDRETVGLFLLAREDGMPVRFSQIH